MKVDHTGHQLPLASRLRVTLEGGKPNWISGALKDLCQHSVSAACTTAKDRLALFKPKRTFDQSVNGLSRTAAVTGAGLQRRIKLGSKTHGVQHSSIIVNNDLRSREKKKHRVRTRPNHDQPEVDQGRSVDSQEEKGGPALMTN